MSDLRDWAEGLAALDDPRQILYRSYRDTWLRIAAIVDAGERASVGRYGRSRRGEPLWQVTIEPPEPAEATVFVLAGLHAMEHVGTAAALALIERAAGAATPWRRRRLVVVPLANPDGFRAVEAYVAGGRRGFRRTNADGVDLNRNFAVHWDDRYYLNRLLRPIFAPGPEPLSEPETEAIDRLVDGVRPTFAVSLHAFGELIYYPWAGSRERPAEVERLHAIATAMAAAQPHRAYRAMQLGRRTRFFKARGCEIDHLYGRYGALAFLVEIGRGPRLGRPTSLGRAYTWFTPPRDLLERDVDNVVPAIEALADYPAGASSAQTRS